MKRSGQRAVAARACTAAAGVVALLAAVATPARAGQAQTITFEQFADLPVNEVDYLNATASSGLEVVYTSDTPRVCIMNGTGVQARQVGTCTITASQPGDASWDPATPVTRSSTISRGQVQQGTAKPSLSNQLDDPVVFDYIVRPAIAWEGQALPTGTYHMIVQAMSGETLEDADLPFDVDSGLGKYVFNDPPRRPQLDPGWYFQFGCYSGDANYTGVDQECGKMGDPFQMYRKPTHTTVVVEPSPVKYGDPVKVTATTVDANGDPVRAKGATVFFEWRPNDDWGGVEVPAQDGTAAIIISNYAFGQNVALMGQYWDPSSEYGTSWHSPGIRVEPGQQELIFEPPYDLEPGRSQALMVDSNTSNPIEVVSQTPAVCAVTNRKVTARKLGTCSITASQDASDEWLAAKPVTRQFDVVTSTPTLAYPDASTVVGQPIGDLRPVVSGLKGTLAFEGHGLPKGLAVDKSNGVITGTPTEVTDAPRSGSVVVTNGAGRTAGATLRINVAALPFSARIAYPQGRGQLDEEFGVLTPQAIGFSGPVRFWIDQPFGPTPDPADGLPLGLRIDADSGAIMGVPRQAGEFTSTVKASDGITTASAKVTIIIAKRIVQPHLSYPALVKATAGVRLSRVYPSAVGLGENTRFSATGLPKGVKVVTTTGVLRGTPARVGTYVVKVSARGSEGKALARLKVRVARSPVKASLSYPDVRVRVRDRLDPVVPIVKGVSGALRFTHGALPAGLKLSRRSGVLSGRPTKAGAATVRVTVRGSTASVRTTFAVLVQRRR